MKRALSLRMRLTAIILLPLLAVAAAAGVWQLSNARITASEVFDRALLSAALAVSNDVEISGGDALLPRTRDILADTSGGRVFYNVYAPDGVIVAGYASPPVGVPKSGKGAAPPTYFDGTYLGRDVRGVRLQSQAQIDGFAGTFTTTVWQDRTVRIGFVRDLVMRSFATIAGLVASLALIVWFGVHLGLRPLSDLQDAIEKRSGDELSPIRRAVPHEVEGIVATLNALFSQVSRAMTAQTDFVSNAAHQLRNPIAGVLSLAEAVHAAPSPETARARSADLLEAARETADLSQKLLMLDRAVSISPAEAQTEIPLAEHLTDWVTDFRRMAPDEVRVDLEMPSTPVTLRGDPVMLREAVRNLLDNTLLHGGPALSHVTLGVRGGADTATIWVSDNGQGIAAEHLKAARERFRQLAPTSRSGLGLSIAEAVVESHKGHLSLASNAPGLRVEMTLPLGERQTSAPHPIAV